MAELFAAAESGNITPAWLTQALRQSGTLPHGEVVAVELQTTDAFNSQTSHLTLHYSADAPEQAPTRLVLKRNTREAWCIRAQAKEVRFYQTVATLPEHPKIIPPCYAASYDAQSGNSYLLLQDLSETHRQPVTRAETIDTSGSVPRPEYIEATIDTLARLHAFWWEHPLLKTEVAQAGMWQAEEAPAQRYTQRRIQEWEQLMASEPGSTLPAELRTGIEQWLERMPHYWEQRLAPRFATGSKQTLTHGDAYFSNFLCPRQLPGTSYLLDWQSPQVHIGALDLANMLATFWTPAQRHEGQRELRALRRYHDTLTASGVNNYSWEELLDDYRIGLIDWLEVPIWDASNGSSRTYWWPKLQCLFNAVMDWQCLEFMSSTPS
ncbi:oxidoreductase family protein [Dictyobacter kobayashii]|uniref:Aminoglycoside phosphotransferase n=1 Tax=Dictyobacter kobayashii TaxID=2014872 RepID=A0A402AQU9_9CHLR|nr:oxidoreductase family protein [Dictyobacter kobayashii]GCE21470.1 aminoglycoside phosphotransferase [Dictyobacter kobayashii]